MLEIKKIWFAVSLLFAFFSFAQDDLKVKTGTFDYTTYGRIYEYTGEYVWSKESGSKEKLPHGKGTLKQSEKFDKAITEGDVSAVEKFTKKGYATEPYLYDGDWHMGKKHGIGEEKKYVIEKGKLVIQEHYRGVYENGEFNGNGTHKTLNFEYTGDFKAGKRHGAGSIQFVKQPSPPTSERMKQVEVNEKYEGGWEEDMYHGKGTFISFWRDISFTGEFDRNLLANLELYSSGANDMEFIRSLTREIERLFKQGNYTFANGNTYDGECKNGLPSGNGTYSWKKTGDIYVGEFEAGVPKGKGKLTKKDGSYFEGVFVNVDCTGKAKMNFKSKFYELDLNSREVYGIYEGEITNNKPEGTGTFTSTKIVNYEEYDDEGNEIKKLVPEYSYAGSWQNGLKNGAGNLVNYFYDTEIEFFTMTTYEGGFKNDLFDGENATLSQKGAMVNSNYVGGFKAGMKQGFGKEDQWSDGIGFEYEGQYDKGYFQGSGKRTTHDPEGGIAIYKGSFQNDYIVQGTVETYQGSEKPKSIYTGAFRNGSEHGKGKIEYFGKFDEGWVDWAQNIVKSYEGDWANGAPNGEGTMIYNNGTKITGKFRNGEYVKPFAPISVSIGTQTWMAGNLSVTEFRNGDPIPEVKTKEEWEIAGRTGKPAFCYFNNDPNTVKTHGLIYNHHAVMDTRILAPIGWKIPSHEDIISATKTVDAELFKIDEAIEKKKNEGISVTEDWKKYSSQYKNYCPQNKFPGLNSFMSSTFITGRFRDGSFPTYSNSAYWSSSWQGDSGIIFNVKTKCFSGVDKARNVGSSYYKAYSYDAIFYTLNYSPQDKGNGYPVKLIKAN
jgi:uncharacterized protein (TIGR02145 family)